MIIIVQKSVQCKQYAHYNIVGICCVRFVGKSLFVIDCCGNLFLLLDIQIRTFTVSKSYS
jgi:hypothetical protein